MEHVEIILPSGERLASLEMKVQHIDREIQKINSIEAKLDAVLHEHSRYKGFIGGVVFIGACLFTFIKFVPIVGSLLAKIGK